MLRLLLVVQTLFLATVFADEVVDPGHVEGRMRVISAQEAALTEKEWKELVEGSAHPTIEVKEAALQALGKRLVGFDTPEIVREKRDLFLELVDSDGEDLRNGALAVLETFRPVGDEKIISVVESRIKTSTDARFLAIALDILSDLTPPSAEQVKIIASFLKHPDAQVRRTAAACLVAVGKEAVVVMPELLEALKLGKDRNVVGFSVETLSHIGPDAKEAVPALIALAGDHPSLNVRHYSVIALRKIAGEDPKVKEVLEKAKADPSSYVQAAARFSFDRLDRYHRTLKEKSKEKK